MTQDRPHAGPLSQEREERRTRAETVAPSASGNNSTTHLADFPSRGNESHSPPVNTPSSLYRAECWHIGVKLARRLPHFILGRLASNLAKVYWLTCPSRARVVIQNVLPAVHGDHATASVTARELFPQFALKMADLWRYESGLSIYNLFHDLTGWEHFQASQAR